MYVTWRPLWATSWRPALTHGSAGTGGHVRMWHRSTIRRWLLLGLRRGRPVRRRRAPLLRVHANGRRPGAGGGLWGVRGRAGPGLLLRARAAYAPAAGAGRRTARGPPTSAIRPRDPPRARRGPCRGLTGGRSRPCSCAVARVAPLRRLLRRRGAAAAARARRRAPVLGGLHILGITPTGRPWLLAIPCCCTCCCGHTGTRLVRTARHCRAPVVITPVPAPTCIALLLLPLLPRVVLLLLRQGHEAARGQGAAPPAAAAAAPLVCPPPPVPVPVPLRIPSVVPAPIPVPVPTPVTIPVLVPVPVSIPFPVPVAIPLVAAPPATVLGVTRLHWALLCLRLRLRVLAPADQVCVHAHGLLAGGCWGLRLRGRALGGPLVACGVWRREEVSTVQSRTV